MESGERAQEFAANARRARGEPLVAPLVVRLAGGGLKREPCGPSLPATPGEGEACEANEHHREIRRSYGSRFASRIAFL